jgi:hypothetical protein
MMRNRRAALEGLTRILDAGAPEDLFSGPEDEAAFLHALLTETAKARGSAYYWEICRTARRRGVTPDYVIDRAIVLLGAIHERRRTDLYRILGVPPLSTGEAIRQRWLEVVKRLHPDTGGDALRFQQAKQAYEVLREPGRRAEYERFWLRTHGPFERVAFGEDVPEAEPAHPVVATWVRADASAETARANGECVPEPPAPEPPATAPLADVHGLVARARRLLDPVRDEDLDALRTEVARAIERLETVRVQLGQLAALRAALRV